jgi:hypothetical protein
MLVEKGASFRTPYGAAFTLREEGTAILPNRLLRRSRRGRRSRGRLSGMPCVPSLMATGAPLAAMGPPRLPPALPLGSSRLSAAGVGRRGVRNGWSGFLRPGHDRLEHARNREAERRAQPKQGKHFSARNVFTHIDLPVSRFHLPRSPIKAISCEHRLNIPLAALSQGERLGGTEVGARRFPLANVVSEDPLAKRPPGK